MYIYQTIKRLSLVALLLSVSAKNNAIGESLLWRTPGRTPAALMKDALLRTSASLNLKGALWSHGLGGSAVKATLPAVAVAGLGYCGYRGLNSLRSKAVTKSGTELQEQHADVNATFPLKGHSNVDEVFPRVESLLKTQTELQVELQKKEAALKVSEVSLQEVQKKEAALKVLEVSTQEAKNEINDIKKVLNLVEQELTQAKQQVEQKNNQLVQQKTEQRDVLVSATPAQNNKCGQCKKCSNKKCSKKNGKKHRRGSKKLHRSGKKTSRKGNLRRRKITLRKKK